MMIDMGSLAACHEQEEQTVSCHSGVGGAHTVFSEKKLGIRDVIRVRRSYISSYLYFPSNTLLILQSQY